MERVKLEESDDEYHEVKRRFLESVTAQRYSSKTEKMEQRVTKEDIEITKVYIKCLFN